MVTSYRVMFHLPLQTLFKSVDIATVSQQRENTDSHRYKMSLVVNSWCHRVYIECQAFFLVVQILSTHPLTRKGVLLLLPIGSRGETLAYRERGWGNPIPTKGQTLWYSTVCTYPTVVYSYKPSMMGEVHLLDKYYSRVRS
jgi:hypothetical protein